MCVTAAGFGFFERRRGRYTPNMWVPPIIGPALITAETQKQFGEIRAEILRRSAMARPPM
jgi:uncharacterized membrane protein YGL010W